MSFLIVGVDENQGLFHGWNRYTVAIAAIMVANGLAVSAVLVHLLFRGLLPSPNDSILLCVFSFTEAAGCGV